MIRFGPRPGEPITDLVRKHKRKTPLNGNDVYYRCDLQWIQVVTVSDGKVTDVDPMPIAGSV